MKIQQTKREKQMIEHKKAEYYEVVLNVSHDLIYQTLYELFKGSPELDTELMSRNYIDMMNMNGDYIGFQISINSETMTKIDFILNKLNIDNEAIKGCESIRLVA